MNIRNFENSQVIKTSVIRNGKLSTFDYQPDVWRSEWFG